MPTIRENLLALIKFVEEEPIILFYLGAYEKATHCGTLHCTLGLAATKPYFQEQGLRIEGGSIYTNNHYWFDDELNKIFGDSAHTCLFKARACGFWDYELIVDIQCDQYLAPESNQTVSDKDLALMRLRKQLALYPE